MKNFKDYITTRNISEDKMSIFEANDFDFLKIMGDPRCSFPIKIWMISQHPEIKSVMIAEILYDMIENGLDLMNIRVSFARKTSRKTLTMRGVLRRYVQTGTQDMAEISDAIKGHVPVSYPIAHTPVSLMEAAVYFLTNAVYSLNFQIPFPYKDSMDAFGINCEKCAECIQHAYDQNFFDQFKSSGVRVTGTLYDTLTIIEKKGQFEGVSWVLPDNEFVIERLRQVLEEVEK